MVDMAVATTEDIMAAIMEDIITIMVITIMADMAGGEQAWDWVCWAA